VPGIVATKIALEEIEVVMFLSYRFNDTKRNYYITEREALAGIRAIEETA